MNDSLQTVYGGGSSIALEQRNRLLLLGRADGFAERSPNFGFVGTHGRQKHPSEPVQFGMPIAFVSPRPDTTRTPEALPCVSS